MAKTKKLMNDPAAVVDEMIDGMLGAHGDVLERTGRTGRAIVLRDGPRDGKVGIVVGGGSGHEPAFVGYVGRGLADGAALGNVFASPSPEPILEATRAVDGGAGVVYLYGNYAGDVMNFDMASEEAADEGIDVRSVAVCDDVASAPPDRADERRGVAGDLFVFKIAGAAADRMRDLDGVVAAARTANRSTYTMGVALSACSLPQTLKPNFELGEGDMEIGMGVHGEPGIRRGPVESADAVVDTLMDRILAEADAARGSEVAVLVNGLGATSLMELYILHRRVEQRLAEAGVRIYRSFVGEYVSSLEMAGASVSLLKLDAELKELLDHPCRGATFRWGAPAGAAPAATARERSAAAVDRERRRARDTAGESSSGAAAEDTGDLTTAVFIEMMRQVRADIECNKDWLSELDGIIGDGDHGVTMATGWNAVGQALEELGPDLDIETVCRCVAKAFLDAVGASSGPLYATAFNSAGRACSGRHRLDAEAVVAFLNGAVDGLHRRGNAKRGDKTMMDAWLPAVDRARSALKEESVSVQSCLDAAVAGAEEGMKATADMTASKGRSSKLGERSLGHIDPGAASTFVTLRAMAQAYRRAAGAS